MISTRVMVEVGIHPTQARAFVEPLRQWLAAYGIDTPNRVAGFLGQIMIESINLTALEENLRYTRVDRLRRVFSSRIPDDATASRFVNNPEALANHVYGGRLGNAYPGDGWRFRGRGLKQLTGRFNYTAEAETSGIDYVADPDLVATPEHAVRTACSFWQRTRCNGPADAQDWDGVTRLVNGPGMLQARERALATRRVLRAIAMERAGV